MSSLMDEISRDIVDAPRLRSENARLRSENARLRSENARLRSENALKDSEILRVAMLTPERNIDRSAHLTDTNPGGDISTAFSFYLEEQYPPKLRGAVCMDRAYYDFLLWLFSAPGHKGATK